MESFVQILIYVAEINGQIECLLFDNIIVYLVYTYVL